MMNVAKTGRAIGSKYVKESVLLGVPMKDLIQNEVIRQTRYRYSRWGGNVFGNGNHTATTSNWVW